MRSSGQLISRGDTDRLRGPGQVSELVVLVGYDHIYVARRVARSGLDVGFGLAHEDEGEGGISRLDQTVVTAPSRVSAGAQDGGL